MIEPDVREALWYDIKNILHQEPDFIPHYWDNLITSYQFLEDDEPQFICQECNNAEENLDIKGDIVFCTVNKNHKILVETVYQSIQRIVNNVLELLKEPSGYKMSLFDLESIMFWKAAEEDDYFETISGEVTKIRVKKHLSKVKKLIMSKLMKLKDKIRFTSTMRTPPIQVK